MMLLNSQIRNKRSKRQKNQSVCDWTNHPPASFLPKSFYGSQFCLTIAISLSILCADNPPWTDSFTWFFNPSHRVLQNLNAGFTLWHPGVLPPALLAFEGHMQRIESSWHMAELGHRSPQIDKYILEAAAVLHFSGPAKPWLEIADPEVQSFWYKHVNDSNKFITKCGIMGWVGAILIVL